MVKEFALRRPHTSSHQRLVTSIAIPIPPSNTGTCFSPLLSCIEIHWRPFAQRVYMDSPSVVSKKWSSAAERRLDGPTAPFISICLVTDPRSDVHGKNLKDSRNIWKTWRKTCLNLEQTNKNNCRSLATKRPCCCWSAGIDLPRCEHPTWVHLVKTDPVIWDILGLQGLWTWQFDIERTNSQNFELFPCLRKVFLLGSKNISKQ